MKTNIKTLAAALAAIISVGVLTSCSANTAQTNPEPTETTITTTTTSQTTPETTEKPQTTSAKETTPSSTKAETQTDKADTTEKTTAPTSAAPSTAAPATTATASTTKPATASTAPASTTAPAPEWTESAVSGTRYVNTAGIYSRSKAVLGASTVKQYSLNDAVTVVAVTNTGYYKLSDGSFIHADYLCKDKVVVQTTKPNTSKPSTTAKPSTTTPSTTEKPSITKPSTSTTAKPNSWREGETEEHYNAALKVAKKIADEVRAEVGKEKSLKQIAFATDKVAEYYDKCSYDDTKVVNWSAWGVFIGKEASCAGATKALGMVLEQLGYEWEHMYEHSHGHQFCKVVNFSYNNLNPYADADLPGCGFYIGSLQSIDFKGRFYYVEDEDVFFPFGE